MIWCRKSVGNILVYWFEIPMTIITNRSIMINVLIIMEFVLWIIRTEIDIERERRTRNRLMNCRCNGDDDDSITSFSVWFSKLPSMTCKLHALLSRNIFVPFGFVEWNRLKWLKYFKYHDTNKTKRNTLLAFMEKKICCARSNQFGHLVWNQSIWQEKKTYQEGLCSTYW